MTTYEKRVAQFKNRHGIGYRRRGVAMPIKKRSVGFDDWDSGGASGGWQGAKLNRLTSDWILSTRTQDAEIQGDICTLRDRCRSIGRTDWGVSAKRALINNVLKDEVGYSLQMQIVRPPDYTVADKPANDMIEMAWWEWCMKQNCTVTGADSFFDVLVYDLVGLLESGGLMLRKIYDPSLPFGFALKVIEVDHINVNQTETLPNGNRIVMGIEKNRMGRVLAYHLTESHPGDLLTGGARYNSVRVDASEIIHHFIRERPGQSLGVPILAPSLARVRQLQQYELAEVIAARSAAEKGGYFTSKAGDKYPGDDILDENGNVIGTNADSEPGQNDMLPEGTTFTPYDPTHPTSQYGQFTKDQLLGISAGWGIDYATLTGDLSNANYSSMRSGKLESQETWKKLQSHQICHLVREVFDAWLPSAILSGAINLPMSKLKLFNKPKFKGRRWPWVDPLKDITAAKEEISFGLNTRSNYLAESDTGEDFEDVINELKREKELAESAGLEFGEVGQEPSKDAPDNEDAAPTSNTPEK